VTDRTDRLATQLLLIARDPGSGRLRHPGSLDIGLRAALFTDLLLSGRITEQRGGPFASEAGASDDRILDAVQRTVAGRPGVAWWRWFRHVRVDRDALVGELTASGRWTADGRVRPQYADEQSGAALEHAEHLLAVAALRAAPNDCDDAVLAVLATMCGSITGRPRPRALRHDLSPLVDGIARSDVPGAAHLPRVLRGAAMRIRRPMRR
jgi:hypothetical protein